MNKFKSVAIIYLFSLALPLTALAQDTTKLENPLGTRAGILGAQDVLARVASGLVFITGTLALLFIIIGGYMILSAAGNSERFDKGKKTITYAIIGLLVTISSYQILANTINILTGVAVNEEGAKLPEFRNPATLIDPLGLTTLPNGSSPAFVFFGQRVIGFMVNLLGVAVVMMYVWGGLQWMLSAGSEDKISKAKKTLLYATIGAIVVLSSYLLIKFIFNPIAATLFTG